jgi:hypothetical protein
MSSTLHVHLRSLYRQYIEVVVFWVVTPCSQVIGKQSFGGRAASIFRVEVSDHEDVFTALLPTTTSIFRRENPELCNLQQRLSYHASCAEHFVWYNTVRVIKSRRMRWAGHVARMGEGRGVYRVLGRKV